MSTGISLYRRLPADPAAWFSPEQIARGADYHRPLRRVGLAESVVALAGLSALVAVHAAGRLLSALGHPSWPAAVLAVTAGLVVVGWAAALPFGWWRLGHERRWQFARQSTALWLSDEVKGLIVTLVLLCPLALGGVAVVRATSWWWLPGWVGLSAVLVLVAGVAPVVIAPLFNRFTPLTDADLLAAALDLGKRAGVPVTSVLVADASRRTSKHNAYVAGLGRSRRVVVWDTLLADYGPAATLAVLAHELSHAARRHLAKTLALTAAVALPALLLLDATLSAGPLRHWAGISGPGDPAALPLAVLVAALAQAAWLPAQAWVSRGMERQADYDSVVLTGDATAVIALQRDLATTNLADPYPPRWVYALASHPPAAERMALAAAVPPAAHLANTQTGGGAGQGR